MIYFVGYAHRKSKKMLILLFNGLIEENKLIEENNRVWKNRHWKFDDTKILIDTDDKFSDDITFKNVVILMTSFIKKMVNFIQNYSQEKH